MPLPLTPSAKQQTGYLTECSQNNDGGCHAQDRTDGGLYIRYSTLNPTQFGTAKGVVKQMAAQHLMLAEAAENGAVIAAMVTAPPAPDQVAQRRLGHGKGNGIKECQFQGCNGGMKTAVKICPFCRKKQQAGYKVRLSGKRDPATYAPAL